MDRSYWHTLGRFGRDVRLFFISVVLIAFSFMGVYGVLLNLYLLRLGYSPPFVGLVTAAAHIAAAATALPAAVLGMRWGSRRLLLLGVACATLGLGCLPLADYVPDALQSGCIVGCYMLAWVGASLYLVNFGAFLSGATDAVTRMHAFAINAALAPLSAFAGALVGGWLPSCFVAAGASNLHAPDPYRWALLLGVLPLMGSLGPLLGTREVTQGSADIDQHAPSATMPLGLIALLGSIILLQSSAQSVVGIFFNVYLDVDLRVSTSGIGGLMASAHLLAAAAALTAPLCVRRWGHARTYLGGTLALGLALLPLGLVRHWTAAGVGYISTTLVVAIVGPTIGVLTMELVAAPWRPMMGAVTQLATALTAVLIGVGGGWVITLLGYRAVFLLVAAGVTLAGGLVFLASRHTLERLGQVQGVDPATGHQHGGQVASTVPAP